MQGYKPRLHGGLYAAMASMQQVFRTNEHLQQFVLSDVTSTGRILGTGSYGSVEEVSSLLATVTGLVVDRKLPFLPLSEYSLAY